MLHVKPKVLEQEAVIDWVETAIRAISRNNCAHILCEDQDRAQVIGDVAADWVSRLLGEVRLRHMTSAQSTEEVAAVCLVWSHAPFNVLCVQACAACDLANVEVLIVSEFV